eukprot:10505032-Alexandrium_andersonii.AAC.1
MSAVSEEWTKTQCLVSWLNSGRVRASDSPQPMIPHSSSYKPMPAPGNQRWVAVGGERHR